MNTNLEISHYSKEELLNYLTNSPICVYPIWLRYDGYLCFRAIGKDGVYPFEEFSDHWIVEKVPIETELKELLSHYEKGERISHQQMSGFTLYRALVRLPHSMEESDLKHVVSSYNLEEQYSFWDAVLRQFLDLEQVPNEIYLIHIGEDIPVILSSYNQVEDYFLSLIDESCPDAFFEDMDKEELFKWMNDKKVKEETIQVCDFVSGKLDVGMSYYDEDQEIADGLLYGVYQ